MSDDTKVVKRRGPMQPSQFPFNPQNLRDELLKAAGFDEDKQIELMVKVVESAEDALEANKVTPITSFGRITDTHTQPDHSARAKAREQIIDLLGAGAKQASPGHTTIPITITPPAWMQVTMGSNPPAIPVQSTATDIPTEPVTDVEALPNTTLPHIDTPS